MADIHGHKRSLISFIRRIEMSESLSDRDKSALLRFKDQCLLNISEGRTIRYLQCMKVFEEWLDKDLEDATKDDIKNLAARLNETEYTEWTRQMFRVAARKFWQFIRGFEWNSKEYPEEVSWLRTSVKANKKKLPEEMLTKDDIKKLITSGVKPRNRAFVSLLYESGCRIGELLTMRIRNVEFDQMGAKLTVSGKTGSRVVRVVSSAPYLQRWINEHPKLEKDSWLWMTSNGKSRLGYSQVRYILNQIRKRSGIRKPVNPHNFRHSRATHLANDLTEAQMCEFFGWRMGSDQPSTYVHLSGRDIDNAILKTYGMAPEKKKDDNVFSPSKCVRCDATNPPTNKFCSRCGMVLDEETATEIITSDINKKSANEVMDILVKDEKFRKYLIDAVRNLNDLE